MSIYLNNNIRLLLSSFLFIPLAIIEIVMEVILQKALATCPSIYSDYSSAIFSLASFFFFLFGSAFVTNGFRQENGKKKNKRKSTETHTRNGNKKRKAFQSFVKSLGEKEKYTKQGYAIFSLYIFLRFFLAAYSLCWIIFRIFFA